ncbi:MAG: peptide-methionine (S)-S-oxide reductase [SAR116 cluster bacterium MED-G04]|nr:MAG: peptide-methionine (S)-S-oxide reductase [SAR116 cluster bacterium MED-G04]HCD50603.1 peptide-methionine (S)-S-oxide reductase [Alphaproteobacteria bacterium]HCV63263.1 peptide-methionine (S)-S-oxide reductase [Alphaproteobacteria bacterium]
MLMKSISMPGRKEALPGRDEPVLEPMPHAVLGNPIVPPYPEGLERIVLGLGCFWGAERIFWQTRGVWTTSVGYAGGYTPNATYREVCSGGTGHTEVVEVVFNPDVISLDAILQLFWESHDPTQGMRQGNDVGTQYRSAIFTDNDDQLNAALASRDAYEAALVKAGRGAITTEIALAEDYYLAEDYHQQYLHKNPGGYCSIGGCGVSFPAIED